MGKRFLNFFRRLNNFPVRFWNNMVTCTKNDTLYQDDFFELLFVLMSKFHVHVSKLNGVKCSR